MRQERSGFSRREYAGHVHPVPVVFWRPIRSNQADPTQLRLIQQNRNSRAQKGTSAVASVYRSLLSGHQAD